MSGLRQIAAVTAIGLRAVPQRLGPSLVVIVGMACVVAVTMSILSMSTGFMRTVHNSGRPDRVIVLSRNAQFEAVSSISREDALAIADAPQVQRTADGKPIVSADALSSILVTKKSNGLDFYVVIRGVGPEGFALRPEIRLLNGRMFRPATHELIVGKSAQSEFEGLDIGSKVSLAEGDWTVTGTFESGGSGTESEMLADSATVLSAMRANAFKSMTVMLDRPDDFDRFKSALASNPKLSVDALRESDYLASQSKQLNGFLTVIAYLVGGIMGLGALFGALNTLYAAVSTRSVEIATLRVFGFGAAAILTSVLAEALVLSLLGAAIGACAAWFAFNGDLHAAGSLVFRLTVTPALMAEGIGLACVLGLLGGIFPAFRAARVPVAVALRAS
jgi:putative ABC transport system permease protein